MNRKTHPLEKILSANEKNVPKTMKDKKYDDLRFKPIRTRTLTCKSFRSLLLFIATAFIIHFSIKTSRTYQAAELNDVSFISASCAKLKTLPYKPAITLEGKFKSFGSSGFVFTSSYRLTKQEFSIIGLGALSLHNEWGKRNEGCLWLSTIDLKPIQGKLTYVFPGEHHDLQYETVIIKCSLNSSTTYSSGSLFVNVHGQDIMVYKDKSKTIVKDPKSPFKHYLTYCSPPMYNRVKTARVSEFMQYMYSIGTDYFILYDGGAVDEEMRKEISPFLNNDLAEIADIRGLYRFNTWHGVWVVNDCAYRNHYASEWVVSIDFDEYLTVPPPNTLQTILQANSKHAWITVGSMVWSISHCRPESEEGNEWPVEKMVYHWPHFYCIGDMNYPAEACLSWYGHRKYLINPRKINALEIHRSVDPLNGGIDLNVTIIHNNHFKGLSQVNALLCDEQVGPARTLEWWEKDLRISEVIKKGRKSKLIKLP